MQSKRKTISGPDVIEAVKEMEFDKFATPLKKSLEGEQSSVFLSSARPVSEFTSQWHINLVSSGRRCDLHMIYNTLLAKNITALAYNRLV